MKKSIYFLMMFVGLAFTSCEPMEDIHDEIDANLEAQSIEGVVDYTLTDEDYDALDLSYGNFSSVDDAKEMIPGLLSNKYPVWGKGSLANVTFKTYAPKKNERSLIVYEATDEDGDEYGSRWGNFDRLYQIEDLLNAKFGDEPNRTLVSLTYEWYTSNTGRIERNDGFLLLDGEWNFITGITKEEYAALGENFPDFSNEDEALAKIPTFLENKYAYEKVEKGDIKGVMFNLYLKDNDDVDRDGVVYSREDDPATEEREDKERLDHGFVVYFVYNGTEWVEYDNNKIQSLQFGHDGTTWVADNTVKYTMTEADYGFIASELSGTYPEATASIEQYGNFDRGFDADAEWSEAMVLDAMNVLLDKLVPEAEDGQKYEITFDIYNGAPGTETVYLIKEGGVWIYQE